MINSAKSSGFCIPMVLGLSRCHVTCLGHFLADWGKLVSKHRCFRVSSAVRDNHKQHQLCLAKLGPVFASIFASWRSYFLSPMPFALVFNYSHAVFEKEKERKEKKHTVSSLNPQQHLVTKCKDPSKLIKTAQVFNTKNKTHLFFSSGIILVILAKHRASSNRNMCKMEGCYNCSLGPEHTL